MNKLPLASRPPGAPTPDDLVRWARADEAARRVRLARLRERLTREGVDGYLGVGRENARYLTGFVLAQGEEKVAGDSGRFLVGADEVVVLADSRYREQAEEECPGAHIEELYGDLPARWQGLVSRLRGLNGAPPRRVAVEANVVSHVLWEQLQAAAPAVELVAGTGWVEDSRAVKEPSELERVGVACVVADAALDGCCRSYERVSRSASSPSSSSGTSARTARRRSRSDVACLSGRVRRCRTDRRATAE